MAVSSAQLTVSTSAVALAATESDGVFGFSLVIKNTGSTDVFLGAAGVTTSTGFALTAGATASVDLTSGEALFAVAAVTGTVHVLRVGV